MTVVYVRHSGARNEAEETSLPDTAQAMSALGDCGNQGLGKRNGSRFTFLSQEWEVNDIKLNSEFYHLYLDSKKDLRRPLGL